MQRKLEGIFKLQMKKVSMKSSFLLFLTALIWGMAFVAQSVSMDYMGPFTFNGIRFLMGSLALLPLVWVRRKRDRLRQVPRAGLKVTFTGGICCGLALCTASLFQQFGILYTTVGKAGFITALYIVIVPVMGIFLKKKVSGRIWIGAFLAAFGLYLLCMRDRLALDKGDGYVFIGAVVFAVHILVIDYFSPKADGVELSCIQFLISGVISSILAMCFETLSPGGLMEGIVPLTYAGIMSCGVAYTLQIIGQKGMEPAIASLILSLESVVSVLAGWVFLRQTLSPRELLGCVLVFGAVILVQLPDQNKSQPDSRWERDRYKDE